MVDPSVDAPLVTKKFVQAQLYAEPMKTSKAIKLVLLIILFTFYNLVDILRKRLQKCKKITE
jgi:hypothetical protein